MFVRTKKSCPVQVCLTGKKPKFSILFANLESHPDLAGFRGWDLESREISQSRKIGISNWGTTHIDAVGF